MNQEQDKELDILLRRNARRTSLRSKIAMAVDEENGKKAFMAFEASEHLDADAMNAYAENTLPNPTRIRYAEHLINCDACRKLVTQLAITANPIGVEKKEATVVADVSKQTWGEWFLSLFTIPNLKVVGPVAAVLCIAAITFVAFQRRAELPKTIAGTDETGANRAPSSNAPVSYDGGTNTVSSPNPASSPNQNTSKSEKGDATQSNKEKSGAPTNSPSEQGKNNKGGERDDVGDNREEPKKSAPPAAEKSPIVAQSTSPSPSPGGPAVNNNQTQANTTSDNIAVQQRPNIQAKDGGPNRANRDRSGREESERAQQPSPATASGSTAANKSDDAKTEDKQQEETKVAEPKRKTADADDDRPKLAAKSAPARTVGGKKFYRKGSAWVDTAYNNSETTNIKRNSDEYNALDAGLRSIAEQLGGEVIVVWNGRAYKIR